LNVKKRTIQVNVPYVVENNYDSLHDSKKAHRKYVNQLGSLRYYICPAGMIQVDEVNEGWGLLYCHEHKITIEKESEYFDRSTTRIEEYQVLYSLIRILTYQDSHDKTLNMLRGLEDK